MIAQAMFVFMVSLILAASTATIIFAFAMYTSSVLSNVNKSINPVVQQQVANNASQPSGWAIIQTGA
jgi:hypothetical protein